KVNKTDSCWVWTGALLKTGYGSIRVNHKSERAHRISYVLTHGSIPEGAILRHSCDNPRCVNPDHLISGTKRENTLDAIERGQHVTGERHKNAKLTAADVVTIRYALATGTTGRELAAKYKVDAKTISNIKLNKKWISR
ncbi:MAG: HNH endonuclease, partial [Burkholderiaceae bacterium]|nr:HNH endonuclease [Burkholderiaceae bacterium]